MLLTIRRRDAGRNRPRHSTCLGLLVAIASLAAGCAEQDRIVFDSPTTTQTTTTVAPSTTTSNLDEDPLLTTTPRTPEHGTPDASAPTVTTPPVTTSPPTSEPIEAQEPVTIAWNGSEVYRHGANLPWVNFGCDFGCGQQGGVSSPSARVTASDALNRARDAGMSTVRWWVFPEVRPHVNVDTAGLPVDFTAAVYEDIDTALALAEAADVDLVLTLFPGAIEIPPEWLATPEAMTRFVDVIDDLFIRYANHPRIMTWQVMNEPEWAIWNSLIDGDLVRDFVREVAERVHATTSSLVSLGAARMDGLPLWTDLGLDYLTVHWYDNMTGKSECVPCVSYAELARSLDTDLPILIGEFHHNPAEPVERLQRFRDLGYAGALAWSLLPNRTADGLDIVDDASQGFAAELGTVP